MTGHEMHVAFKVLGQQMGLQAMRGILPESINVFLNLAQNEVLANTIKQHTNIQLKDKPSEKSNNVSPTGLLNSLIANRIIAPGGLMETKSMYGDNIKRYDGTVNMSDVFAIIGAEIKYHSSIKDVFNCRIIEPNLLDNTMKDTLTTASYDEPIMSFYYHNKSIGSNNVIIYAETGVYYAAINYIKKPTIIADSENIICSLHDSLATTVVELAVEKFFNSLARTSPSNKQ